MGSLDYMAYLQALIGDQGMSFSQFFVPQSLCCPARVTFLRGQYTHNHQVYTNIPPLGGFEKAHALGLENATVATALRNRGYHTALIGKYLNGYPLSDDQTYIPPGWDEWFSPVNNGGYGSYNYTVNDNGVLRSYGNTPEDYITDVLAQEGVDFLDRTVTQFPNDPFFLFLSFYAPHSPANPAPRHIDLFPDAQVPRTAGFNEADMSDKPAFMQVAPSLTEAEIQQLDYQYRRRAQSLQAVDEAIELLIQTLQSIGKLDNTYVFFVSDNGYHLGQHRLPVGKGTPYEEDIRLPLVVRGPGVPAGVVRGDLTSMVDLAPTLVEIAGGSLPYSIDGRSLLPLLHSVAPVAGWRQSLLIEHYQGLAQVVPDRPADWEPLDPMDRWLAGLPEQDTYYTALHTKRYIYIARLGPNEELYDTVYDSYQARNRWSLAPATMRSQVEAFLAPMRNCAGQTCRTLEARPPPQWVVPPYPMYLPVVRAR